MPYAGFETLFGNMLNAARRNLFTVMLKVIMLSVLLLIVLMLSVVMLCCYVVSLCSVSLCWIRDTVNEDQVRSGQAPIVYTRLEVNLLQFLSKTGETGILGYFITNTCVPNDANVTES
jgi:hypothetical protein